MSIGDLGLRVSWFRVDSLVFRISSGIASRGLCCVCDFEVIKVPGTWYSVGRRGRGKGGKRSTERQDRRGIGLYAFDTPDLSSSSGNKAKGP